MSILIHIYSVLVSWKYGSISGKIMEFDSVIRLETLYIAHDCDCEAGKLV